MKNAVIDGGFVDMGSVCRVEDVDDPRLFLETLLAAVADLVKTCRQFLRGNAADVEAEYRNQSLTMVLMQHRLLPDLEIGSASCRDRGCQYVSLSVVDGSCKKKQTRTKHTWLIHIHSHKVHSY